MKAITILIPMLLVFTYNVNGQNTDVKGILDNQETRTEIFNAIASDHQLMMDFMKVARENEHSVMMMRNEENHQMEMKKNGMIEMKDEHQMMEMMIMCEKDSAMRSQMANMMTEHSEMMKMCMQKMKEKGIMHTDGKMINTEGKLNHDNHNH